MKPRSILDNDDDDDVTSIVEESLLLPGVPKETLVSAPPAKLDTSTISVCPRCGKPLVAPTAVGGAPSVSWLECPACGALVNTYKPTIYQAVFLKRTERYKMAAGGYGSGKSRVNIEDVIKHLLLIPNARVIVAARSYPALDATFVKEFYSMLPDKLVRRKNDQKHELTLTNGSELLFRSFDDPTKLKSINATMIVIIEASDVPHEGFRMMQSRLRNTAAMLPEFDKNGQPVYVWNDKSKSFRPKYRVDVRHINLETNPDSGWVKKDFLLDSKTVEFYGDAFDEGYVYNKTPDPNKYTQVVSTEANTHLPEGYVEEQTRDKSPAYIAQFFKSSFNFSTNLVLPNAGMCVVPPHKLPRTYNDIGQRVLWFAIGVDYGVNDPTHVVFTAFSTETRKLYVFAEYRTNNTDVKDICKAYRHELRVNGTDLDGLFMLPRFDGRSYNKRESDLATIGSTFEDEGLFFDPAFEGMETRIIKLNSLFNHEQIEIFSTCEFLVDELLNWKFKLDKQGNATNKPVDKNDHGIQALAFVVVALPHNLMEFRLSAFLPPGTRVDHDKRFVKKAPAPMYNPLSKEDSRNDRAFDDFDSRIVAPVGHHDIRAYSVYDEEPSDEESHATLKAYIPGGH